MQAFNEHFDVVVVGAGHAGCEAAMAAARTGLKTALYTLNVDLIAQMSCDPAVWSPRAQCDKQAYRLKMREVLESQPNLKIKQAEVADVIVEKQSLVDGRQSFADSDEDCHSDRREEAVLAADQRPSTIDRITGVLLRDGRRVSAQAVIITTGTFLNGLIHCGEQQYPAGRSGEPAAVLLGEALKK